jgi:hypothetical protein
MGQCTPLLIAFAPGKHAAGILRRELAEPAIDHRWTFSYQLGPA